MCTAILTIPLLGVRDYPLKSSRVPLDVQNLLVDPTTLAITGIVDFENTHVGTRADEFLNGLMALANMYGDPYDADDNGWCAALVAPGSGFADTVPREGPGAVGGGGDWAVARLVDEELERAGARRPRDIAGFEHAGRLYWFAQNVCQ